MGTSMHRIARWEHRPHRFTKSAAAGGNSRSHWSPAGGGHEKHCGTHDPNASTRHHKYHVAKAIPRT
ncbi:hypothetical protein MTY414_45310 [Mycolicibacterium mageritense]|nr:hypothetical protein MTY414_45310 [Mycolicibacterium mageritense]